jgi:hypothetical protein
VDYYTKKRQDDANLLSTAEKNKGLAKGEKREILTFYAEDNRKLVYLSLRLSPNVWPKVAKGINDYQEK